MKNSERLGETQEGVQAARAERGCEPHGRGELQGQGWELWEGCGILGEKLGGFGGREWWEQ